MLRVFVRYNLRCITKLLFLVKSMCCGNTFESIYYICHNFFLFIIKVYAALFVRKINDISYVQES